MGEVLTFYYRHWAGLMLMAFGITLPSQEENIPVGNGMRLPEHGNMRISEDVQRGHWNRI